MSASGSIIETERLVMRPPELSDFRQLYGMWSDVEVVRHVTGAALTQEDVWARLLRSLGHWAAMGFGHWIVANKCNGDFVGEVGFVRLMRGIGEDFDAAPETGWMLARQSQRSGYATEAVEAALRWSDERWPGGETVCIISPENAASIRLATKLAYQADRTVTYKNKDVTVFRRRHVLSR
ncbi:GNAT family N-acetyltransferase [Burkholderia sp. Ax-1719]|jgi:RimJ/RimL family protein N-acetyltransferase|nr:GNAT family N-acetyltransferase [Burkholderia sp. Ax-1719]NIE64126.1 GNAT family N-acetyltransferase [Burkholderia sp. Ax-1719]